MAPQEEVFNQKNAVLVVKTDAQIHSTRSRACSSAKSVVPNACVCLLELMATRKFVPAITIGRPKGEDPNVPERIENFHKHCCHDLIMFACSFFVLPQGIKVNFPLQNPLMK